MTRISESRSRPDDSRDGGFRSGSGWAGGQGGGHGMGGDAVIGAGDDVDSPARRWVETDELEQVVEVDLGIPPGRHQASPALETVGGLDDAGARAVVERERDPAGGL